MDNEPDDETKNILNELLSEVVLLISGYILENMRKVSTVSKETVLATIGDVVPNTFAEILRITDSVHSDTSDALTTLIAEEVTDVVKSGSISRKSISKRIDVMVSKSCKMLKELFGKLCQPKKLMKKVRYKSPLCMEIGVQQSTTFVSTEDGSEREESTEMQRESSLQIVNIKSCDMVSEEATGFESSNVDEKQEPVSPLEIEKIQALSGEEEEAERFHETAATVKASKLKCKQTVRKMKSGVMFKKLCCQVPHSDITGASPGDVSESTYEKTTFPQTSHVAPSDSAENIQASEFSTSEVREPLTSALEVDVKADEACSQDQREREESCKVLVNKLVEDLISQMFTKAKMKCSQQNFDRLRKRWYTSIWAVVEELDFNIPQEKVENLHKDIYKEICKMATLPQVISLAFMDLKHPLSDTIIAQSFKKHMLKKPCAFKTFWSFLINMIQKPFKRISASHQKTTESFIVSDPVPQDQTLESTLLEILVDNGLAAEVPPMTELESQNQVPEPTTCKVTESLTTASEAYLQSDAKQENEQNTKKERCRLSLCEFLRSLIYHLFKKANIKCSRENFETLNERLFEKLWAEITKEDFNIEPEYFKDLHKIIYKDLCQLTSCPKVIILMGMDLEELLPDTIIVKAFRKHISKKPSTIKQFLSSVGRNLGRCNKVSVI